MNIKDYLYFNKRKIIVSLVIISIISLSIVGYFYYEKLDKETVKIVAHKKNLKKENIIKEKSKIEKEKPKPQLVNDNLIMIDIKGLVKNPNVYQMNKGERVIDAINKAGGLLPKADTSLINLSLKVEDGMVIIVYSEDEVKNFSLYLKAQKEREELCNKLINNNACINSKTVNEKSLKVSINKGTKEELSKLEGIGEAKAIAIIKKREEKPFTKLEDLKEVPGIGESLFAKIKENITL